jgi:hypothetical protein
MDSKQTNNSRRRILKGVVAGSAVASIPAKSVWASTVTTSVTTSGQGSGNLQTSCLALRSPGWVKKNGNGYPYYNSSLKFTDIFGYGLIGTLKSGTTYNDLKNVTLQQVLDYGSAGNLEWDSKKNRPKKLGGPENVNRFLVTMFANACISGNGGIWYPVLSINGGSYGSALDYADYIYNSAKLDPYTFKSEVESLIDENHASSHLPDCAY